MQKKKAFEVGVASALGWPGLVEAPGTHVNFPPVGSEELGFALSFFVAAANRKLASHLYRNPKVHRAPLTECELLFLQLTTFRPPVRSHGQLPSTSDVTLPVAFAALWHHYRGMSVRHSVCARVLGFYFLMEETAGGAVAEWIEICPSNPESILLSPAVVEGLAAVGLDETGAFSEARLRGAIKSVLAR
jgi:hypothetical protein